MSVLLIDIGNTRIKWQTRQRGEILAEGHVDKNKAPHYAWPDSIDEVAVSSVSTNEELRELFNARYGNRLRWIAHPVEGRAGFHHCYAEPKRLGVDRWLAMLGARARRRPQRHRQRPALTTGRVQPRWPRRQLALARALTSRQAEAP